MNKHEPSCAHLMSMAERELGAFISAVTESYGPEGAGSRPRTGWMSWKRRKRCVELQALNGATSRLLPQGDLPGGSMTYGVFQHRRQGEERLSGCSIVRFTTNLHRRNTASSRYQLLRRVAEER